ncbi:HesB/IscA family protein [Buchnera aphidicola]|uniref:HesB/IscA family protein n=1 Tax=Buchnera aphidicola TaxID=9 RepID=UPI000B1D7138|nr:iron-sulfur cluster assembly accessory protein [Buchnera aphidicola]
MSQKNYKIKLEKKKWKGIQITTAAEKQMLKLVQKDQKCTGIKINIKKSGCAGLKYILNLVYIQKDSDFIFYNNQIRIFIPKKKINIIEETIIDFSKNGLNYHFTFYNKKNKYHCGCGESFNIK